MRQVRSYPAVIMMIPKVYDLYDYLTIMIMHIPLSTGRRYSMQVVLMSRVTS